MQHNTGLIYLMDGGGRGAPVSYSGPFSPRAALQLLRDGGEDLKHVLPPSKAPKAVYVACEPISIEQLRVMDQLSRDAARQVSRGVVYSERP